MNIIKALSLCYFFLRHYIPICFIYAIPNRYSIPSAYSKDVENLVQRLTTKDIDCDLFIRHKTTLIPPILLTSNAIPFAKVYFSLMNHSSNYIVYTYNNDSL